MHTLIDSHAARAPRQFGPTIGNRLDDLERKHRYLLTSAKVPYGLIRALYWKRRRWEAAKTLDGLGWDASCEGHELEYLDAREDYETASDAHKKIISDLWSTRRLERSAMGEAA